jgi:hypothetical protein
MTYVVPALCLLLTPGLPVGQPDGNPKPKVPPAARVLIVDHVSGFSRGDKTVELRLPGPPKGNVLADAVHVEVPLELMPTDQAGKPQVLGREVVAIQGRLFLGKVAVGHTGSKPAKIIYASSLRVVAVKVDVVDEKDLKQFPAPGKAEVRGKLIAGKFPVQEDEPAVWAVENGELPIVLVGKAAEQAKNLDGAVVVVGRLRLLRPGNVLVLEVESIAGENK